MLIGNASNKLGEFSCVALPISSLKLFRCITKKDKTNGIISHRADFESDLLVNTDWHESGTKYVGCLLPNFFMIYFGQKPPTGDITSNNIKLAFSNVGMGYDAWCFFAEEATNASSKIKSVMDNVSIKQGYNHVSFFQEVLQPTLDR